MNIMTFLKKGIIFSLLSLCLLFIIQWVISIKINDKTVRGHDNLNQTANVNAELVLIGSSRCWAQLDPLFFSTHFHLKTINIGVDGHSEISMAIIRLKNYLSKNKKPRFVIFTFDPFATGIKATKNNNFTHKNDFSRYAFSPNDIDTPFINHFQFTFQEKYVPLYAIFKYKLLRDIFFMDNFSNWVKYGFERHDEIWDTTKNPISERQKEYYFKLSDTNNISSSLDSLNRLCKQNNIKLICLQTPVYKIIYDEVIFSKTNEISNQLHIPFVDVSKSHIRDSISFFYNSNHLNYNGVKEMNNELLRDPVLRTSLK